MYKERYEAAQDGTIEKMDVAMKMIDVIFHYDLDEAIAIAEDVAQMARESGNSDAEAAALMDQAVWIAYKHGSARAEERFQQALEKFDEDGDRRFLAHFYASRFGYALINEQEEYDPNMYLDLVRGIAEELDDPHLMMSYCYMAATSKVFVGGLPPTDPEIIPLRDRLRELTDANSYETGRLNSMLIDAREAQMSGDAMRAAMILAETTSFAQEKQYRLFEVRAQLALAYGQMQIAFDAYVEKNGPVDEMSDQQRDTLRQQMLPVRERYLSCLEVAQQVKMSAYTFEALVYLAFVEMQCGDLEQAARYVSQAEELPYECFRSWVLRDRLYRYAVMIYAEAGDDENLEKYVNKLASRDHITKYNEASEKSVRFRQQLTSLEIRRRQEADENRQVTQQLVVSRDQEKERADMLSSILGYTVLITGLLLLTAALIWSRRRLKETQIQLTDEKATSRKAQQIRKTLEERVNRLQRMESLGMLAGGVAHDFNNLLVGVISNAEMLQNLENETVEFTQERIDGIIASAEKAADLSRQMLAYTGKQPLRREIHDLNLICSEMQKVLRATAGDDVSLTIESNEAAIKVEIDRPQIEQVLLNLVTNARQASGPAGKVVVRTGIEAVGEIERDAELHGTREKGGEFGFVEVQDFGSGFDATEKDRIFEPFYSIDEQGRGLGLSVVYGIVNGHDGFVRVKSEPGKGACFRALFPLAGLREKLRAPLFLKTGDGEVRTRDGNRNRRILVADDEPGIRKLMDKLLARNGWEVCVVANGREAVEYFDSPDFDLVLLDVVMPEMGAQEVLEYMAVHRINLPVVLMSGYSNVQLEQYRKNQFVVDVICKPFRIPVLLEALEGAYRLASGAAQAGRS